MRVFDEAFQSRIHVSLRYHDLTSDARRKIWVAFLRKVHGDIPNGGLSADELRDLGEKRINGRQIKNVVRTASALASGKQEKVRFAHLLRVLDMMDQFDARSGSFRRLSSFKLTNLLQSNHVSIEHCVSNTHGILCTFTSWSINASVLRPDSLECIIRPSRHYSNMGTPLWRMWGGRLTQY